MGVNEVLKEKVDILFKLGRSYIDNANRNTSKPGNEKTEPENPNHDDNIEVVEVIEDDPTNIESLQGWTKMKMRGFKRVVNLHVN